MNNCEEEILEEEDEECWDPGVAGGLVPVEWIDGKKEPHTIQRLQW